MARWVYEPLVIQVSDAAHTDMPHATWSLWMFRFEMRDSFFGPLTFAVTVDILRGDGDVPLWPGHPAFYTDTHARTVLDADASAYEQGVAGDVAPVQAAEAGGPVAPERVISYGTRTLHVFVNITRFDVTNPLDEPTNFWLRFHNASGIWNSTDLFDVANHSADVQEHKWTLPVDDNGMDSPYADGSRWQFELGAAFTQGAPGVFQVTCYRGCATWSADYHITLIATDEVLPSDAYDSF